MWGGPARGPGQHRTTRYQTKICHPMKAYHYVTTFYRILTRRYMMIYRQETTRRHVFSCNPTMRYLRRIARHRVITCHYIKSCHAMRTWQHMVKLHHGMPCDCMICKALAPITTKTPNIRVLCILVPQYSKRKSLAILFRPCF